MPEYWYDQRSNVIHSDDSEETKKTKKFNSSISASRKPYFMIYVYPRLQQDLRNWEKSNQADIIRRFGKYGINSIKSLVEYQSKTQEMIDFIKFYDDGLPVGNNPCTVNRMCWLFENEFSGFSSIAPQTDFDYRILKSNVEYTMNSYNSILDAYKDFTKKVSALKKRDSLEESEDVSADYQVFLDILRAECEQICSNEKELCDILLDICYTSNRSKQFAWDICGDIILENLRENNGGTIHYPVVAEHDYDFTYCGTGFKMEELQLLS